MLLNMRTKYLEMLNYLKKLLVKTLLKSVQSTCKQYELYSLMLMSPKFLMLVMILVLQHEIKVGFLRGQMSRFR